MSGRIVIVDDDLDAASLLADLLQRRGFETVIASSATECLEQLARAPYDVVLTDVHMAGVTGIELCEIVRERYPDLLSIVITGYSGFAVAVAAIRAGAYDYITKPIDAEMIALALARALAHLELRREVDRLRATTYDGVLGIAGDSEAVREMLELVRRAAASDATVLVSGESGTGKELVARALHELSARRDQPFVAINCAAIPAQLLESELFGHVRGAFTDAHVARAGVFARAGAGTIFLDELGEMPIEMQVKLLRVLQEHAIRPVGSDEEIRFAARVIASTNRDLDAEVTAKRFREDLFYRINVVAIAVPPLRARGHDVLVLAQLFVQQIAARIGKPVQGLTPAAAQLLVDYDWPGNVRELENCMERAVALCRLDQITLDDLPPALHDHRRTSESIPLPVAQLVTLAEMERRHVRNVLAAVAGNKTRAAHILGIDRRSVYRRLHAPVAGGGEIVAEQLDGVSLPELVD